MPTKEKKRAQLQMANLPELPEPEEEEVAPASKSTGKKYTEKPPLIYVGTWVRLADTDNVPEEVVGHEAQVTVAPMKNSDGDKQIPWRHQYQDADMTFTVQTRDEYSATIAGLTVDDFSEISYNGRAGFGSTAG